MAIEQSTCSVGVDLGSYRQAVSWGYAAEVGAGGVVGCDGHGGEEDFEDVFVAQAGADVG